MRWPWGVRAQPEPAQVDRRHSVPTVSPAGWAALPPLSTQLAPVLTTADLTFPGPRSSWSSPALTGTVQRQVTVGMPVLARPRFPEPAAGAPPGRGAAAGLPVLARRAPAPHAESTPRHAGASPPSSALAEVRMQAPHPVISRALTTSTDDILPVLTLTAEPPGESPREHRDAPVAGGPGEPEDLRPLHPGPEAPSSSMGPEPPASAAPRTGPSSGAVARPPAALPLAVQRSTASPPGPSATEVAIPSTSDAPAISTGAPPPSAAPVDQRTAGPDRSVSDHLTPVQRQAARAPQATHAASSRSGQRLGLGAPLPPAPPATATATDHPLPVVQRSTSSPAAATRPPQHRPAPFVAEPGLTALAPTSTADRAADPDPNAGDAEPSPSAPSLGSAPFLSAPVDVADASEASPHTEGGGIGDVVGPEAPTAPPPMPLTLSRSVDPPPDEIVDHPLPAATRTDPAPPTQHHTVPEVAPGSWAPGPTVSRTPDSGEPRGLPPGTAHREVVTPHPPPTPALQRSLPVVGRDAGRLTEIVVSRSGAAGPQPRLPEPVDRPKPGDAPWSAHPQFVTRTNGAAAHGRGNQSTLTLPRVQRATQITGHPGPPTVQRLPGLSTLPRTLPDRPSLPAGPPRLPGALTRPPAGLPDSLPSVPADLPWALGAPAIRSEVVPDPGRLPMPVSSARALVAAVAGASPADSGTPPMAAGIPTAAPIAGAPADTAPEGPPAPAPGVAAGPTPPVGPPATTGAVPALGAVTTPQQLDELARRLYGPLAASLRAELLLDRERRGLRTDAW